MKRRAFVTALVTGSVAVAGCGRFSGETEDRGAETETLDGDPSEEGKEPTTGDASSDGSGSEIVWEFWRDADDLTHVGTEDGRTVVAFDGAERTAALVNEEGFGIGIGSDDPSRSPVKQFGPIEWSIDFEAGATEESPARASAVAINPRSRSVTLNLARHPLLGGTGHGSTRDGNVVYLVPTEGHPLAQRVPEYHRNGVGHWQLDERPVPWFPDAVTFPPERGFVAEYYLLTVDGSALDGDHYEFSGGDHGITLATFPTDVPGVERESRFAGVDPPPLQFDDGRNWYHEETPDSRVYFEPDAEVVALPGTITFTFINQSDQAMSGIHSNSRLYKLVDGEWLGVHPQAFLPAIRSSPAWSFRSWEMKLFHGEAQTDRGVIGVGHLGGGTYAYESAISAGRGRHAALFEVDAPAVTADRQPGATLVENGAHRIVEAPRFEGASNDRTITVSRIENADADRRLIPEHLYRQTYEPYRNTLPVFEPGVETVTLRTSHGPLDLEASDDPRQVVEYEGETYRFEIEQYDG